eukprot:CAMPEP_0194366276 /NCGR_PEP_ID=MMETSP0174-20130528/14298_1 /TAXON_ID=216777 /ORGANISM="Proboscia alata, Strain PI-D3" /LENGTH=41 /DNA_ID= /DNA_START= /DNA_END= /DNA_ORIENTATION=
MAAVIMVATSLVVTALLAFCSGIYTRGSIVLVLAAAPSAVW